MTATLAAALEAYKPEIAAQYERIVRVRFERMVADLGENLTGVFNSWEWAKVFNGLVRPNVRHVNPEGRVNTGRYEVAEDRLAANARTYADLTVAAWEKKIEAKMGELEDAEVRRLDSFTFRIFGTKNGRKVEIEQSMIVNVSSKGTPFNQFPARIYLEGKFVSEAKFKKLAA